MTEINFGSTYRIPVSQQGINQAKKVKLKALVGSYGGVVGTGNTGYARVSIPNEKDTGFVNKLKKIGYSVYQVFKGEKIKPSDLDEYIKSALNSGEYAQKGTQKAKVVKNSVEKRKANLIKEASKDDSRVYIDEKDNWMFGNWDKEKNKAEQDRIRQTQGYKDMVAEFGKEVAEAAYFYSRKTIK